MNYNIRLNYKYNITVGWKLVLKLLKIATKILINNPNAQQYAKKIVKNAYKKNKPLIDKKTKIVKDTLSEISPLDDPIKFFNKLKNNTKKNN